MFCPNCGTKLPDDSKFCENCGTALGGVITEEKQPFPEVEVAPEEPQESAPQAPKKKRQKTIHSADDIEGEKVTPNIYFCPDGVYRWVYEMPMLKNPTILFTVWKVMGISSGVLFLFLNLVSLLSGDMALDYFLFTVKLLAILIAVFLVLGVIAYLIVAATYGWKYVVAFEMDEKQLKHIQIPRQQKKAEILGLITALAGIAARRPSAVGVGLVGAGRTSTTTNYARVRKIKANPSRHLIKLNEKLMHNQVYAEPEDFEFVLNYLKSRCTNAQ